MKRYVLQFGAFLMALLVLFSSTSFLKSEHFCKEQLTSVSYFSNADSCGMEVEKTSCTENNAHKHIAKKSCCKTITKIVEGDDFSKETTTLCKVDIQKNLFVHNVQFFEQTTSKTNSFEVYRPPLILKDRNILYETYLI